jgi:hypothetical protein
MGKAMAVEVCKVRSVEISKYNIGARNHNFPIEFQNMPLLLPPTMEDPNNPDKYWMVHEDWKSPSINGYQACIRAPIRLTDGRVFGFFTDGISVPQLAWTLAKMHPFSMPELCGALPHDIVYSAELADRATCDKWLREWEKMAGVSKARSNAMYCLVKIFGGIVWDKHTPKSIEEARVMCQLIPEGTEPVWGSLPRGMVALT